MKPAVQYVYGVTCAILVISEVVALLASTETTEIPGAIAATPIPVNLVSPRRFPDDGARPLNGQLKSLPGGLYVTAPDAILLKVPGEIGDNRILNDPESLPQMPVRHPELRVIPAYRAQK